MALPSVPLLGYHGQISCSQAWAVSFGVVVATCVFFFFAKSSSDVLAEARYQLVDNAWEPKAGAQPNQALQPTALGKDERRG